MAVKPKTQKPVKTVSIIARVQFKSDPRKVVYLVQSSNGVDQYQVSFYAGKATNCTCPATKPCYHMTQCETREQAHQAEQRAQYVQAFDPCGLGV